MFDCGWKRETAAWQPTAGESLFLARKEKGMTHHSDYAVRERGGIQVRDYTRGDSFSAVRRELGETGLRGILDRINFNRVSRALTWVSLGLGIMQLTMPKQVQKLVGVRRGDHSGLIRFIGAREIISALLIMTQAHPHRGVWSRVLGDGIDVGLLGAAYNMPRVKKNRVTTTAAALTGLMALDALTASQLNRQQDEGKRYSVMTNADLNSRAENGAFHVSRSVTINRSPEELYNFWRNFENLPRFMYHLEKVEVLDDRHSHWVANAPGGANVSWDAEITDERPTR
jgi:hypothetical protein